MFHWLDVTGRFNLLAGRFNLLVYKYRSRRQTSRLITKYLGKTARSRTKHFSMNQQDEREPHIRAQNISV